MSSTTRRARPPAYRMFTMRQIEEASSLQSGYCLACGTMAEGCEPDAREYECEACDEPKVYGAEELVIMGRVR